MKRRNFVLGLGTIATGSVAAVGSGAFTSVEAERDITVEVAEDSDAFLALEDGDSDLVTYDDGVLVINLDGEGALGEGIGDDSRYQLGNFDSSETNFHENIYGNWVADDGDPTEEFAFAITNQGTTSYHITIEGDFGDTGYRGGHQAHVAFGLYYEPLDDGQYGGAQQEDAVASGGNGPTVSTNADDGDPQEVDPGETVYVSMLFDTSRPNVEVGSDELDGSITITAE